MHTIGSCGEGDIHPAIYKDASGPRARQLDRTSRQFEQIARGQVLFPDLDKFDAGRGGARNAVKDVRA
jgi:hypothetical protein